MKELLKAAKLGRTPLFMVASGVAVAALFAVNQPEEIAPRPTPVAVTAVPVKETAPINLSTPTVDRLNARFQVINYDLVKVREGAAPVPRVLPDAIPNDLARIEQADERKKTFVQLVLPMILVINESLQEDRSRIIDLRDQLIAGDALRVRDRAWLDERFKEYKVEPGDFEALLTRVDVVPPSLALAQAAIESGWGTSRFARKGNALFGQWTTAEHEGIVPERREEGKTHKIRAFRSPVDGVASYLRNLNTHGAYKKLRTKRAALRAQNKPLDSMFLAEALEAYSEKGMEYVRLVQSIIRVNELHEFDGARLADGRPQTRGPNA